MSERPRTDAVSRLLRVECSAVRWLESVGLSEKTNAVDLVEYLVRHGFESFSEFRMQVRTEAYKTTNGRPEDDNT